MLFIGGQLANSAPQQDSLATITGIVQKENKPGYENRNFRFPLGGCSIQLFFDNQGILDSLSTVSNASSGRFSFNGIAPQRVMLRVRCMGFETQSGMYEIGAGENAFCFIMKETTEELSAARIAAEIRLMKQINDTTIYNVQAIKTLPGDGLSELLSSIPGFSIKDNSVTYDGVKVARTYVNGLLLFGDNSMGAVNALHADEVKQVKVYDEQNALDKHQGAYNSKKERVLNVITRNSFASLSRASGILVGGTDDENTYRYGISGGINYDSEMLNLSASIISENIYDQTIAETGADTGSYLLSIGTNLPESDLLREGLGISLNKYWKNRTLGNSFKARYTFTHERDASETWAITDYFQQEDQILQTSVDSTKSKCSNYKHSLLMSCSLQDTHLKSFDCSLSLDVSDRESVIENRDIWLERDIISKQRKETSGSEDSNCNIYGSVSWTNNDAVRWRPRIDLQGNYRKGASGLWTSDTLSTSFHKRNISGDGEGETMAGGISAGVFNRLLNNLRRTLDLNVTGNVYFSRTDNKQLSLDNWNRETTIIDIGSSHDYEQKEINSSAVASLSYSNDRKTSIAAKFAVNNKLVLNNERIPRDFSGKHNFFFPSYSFSLSHPHYSLSSSSEEITPTVEQLSNRVSDSNPMVLSAGNPDLKQAYRFNLNANYQSGALLSKDGATHSISCIIKGSAIISPLVNRNYVFTEDTFLDRWDGYKAQAGSMLFSWDNSERAAWNVGTTVRYDTRIFKNKVGLMALIAGSYNQSPIYLGDMLLWQDEIRGSATLNLQYNPTKKFKMVGQTHLSYVNSVDNKKTMFSQRIEARESISFTYIIFPRVRWECNYLLSVNKSMEGFGKNDSCNILNTKISYDIVKDRSLTIALSCHDLLNSNAKYSIQTTALYMTQQWQRYYGRFLIVSIKYHFRKKNSN
ncbi:MAG: TonB-dependent receptor [Bacteroidales bacterium]|nr:TonB-dependent receptor [Bacteroidales bacterium]